MADMMNSMALTNILSLMTTTSSVQLPQLDEDVSTDEEPEIPGSIPIPRSGSYTFAKRLKDERFASKGNPEARNSLYLRDTKLDPKRLFGTFVPQLVNTDGTYMLFGSHFEALDYNSSRREFSTDQEIASMYLSHRLEKDQTRTLELEVTQDQDAPLSCKLARVHINKPGYHIGLSYAWGMKSGPLCSTRLLKCDDVHLRIGDNLEAALRAVRRLWKRWRPEGQETRAVPSLWADAVCINQRDQVERFNQVMLMKSVYRNSDSLLIWLGPASCEQHQRILQRLERESLADVRSSESEDGIRELCEDIVRREWFYRRWIIQEVAMSDKTGHEDRYLLRYLSSRYPELEDTSHSVLKVDKSVLKVDNIDALRHRYQLYADKTAGHVRENDIINELRQQGQWKSEEEVLVLLRQLKPDPSLNVTLETFIHLVAHLRNLKPTPEPTHLDRYIHRSKSRRYFLLGDALITFETLMNLIITFSVVPTPIQPLTSFRKHNLLQSMLLYDGAGCADARDLIYAVYGISHVGTMSHVGIRADFQWNYLMTDVQLFECIADLYAKSEYVGLLLLCALGRTLYPSSWVPDWRQSIHYSSVHHKDALERYRSLLLKPNADLKQPKIMTEPLILNSQLHVPGWTIEPCRYHGFCVPFSPCPDCANSRLTSGPGCPYREFCIPLAPCMRCAVSTQKSQDLIYVQHTILAWLSKLRIRDHRGSSILFLEECNFAFRIVRSEELLRSNRDSALGTPEYLYHLADCYWIPEITISETGQTNEMRHTLITGTSEDSNSSILHALASFIENKEQESLRSYVRPRIVRLHRINDEASAGQ